MSRAPLADATAKSPGASATVVCASAHRDTAGASPAGASAHHLAADATLALATPPRPERSRDTRGRASARRRAPPRPSIRALAHPAPPRANLAPPSGDCAPPPATLVGENDLARRVRPSARRSGVTADDEGSDDAPEPKGDAPIV